MKSDDESLVGGPLVALHDPRIRGVADCNRAGRGK